jgi:hypothetical protein
VLVPLPVVLLHHVTHRLSSAQCNSKQQHVIEPVTSLLVFA